MKYRMLMLLAGVLVFGPAALRAQVVQGKVLDNLGMPMRGAFVVLLDTGGKQLGAVLAGEHGDFTFRVVPGKYTLRAEQIGHKSTALPAFEVTADRPVVLEIKMEVEALHIGELSVSATNRCSQRPDGSTQTAAVWSEVRKALNVAAWMQGMATATFRVKNYERDADLEFKDTRAPKIEFASRAGRNAFVAANVDSLADLGFMQIRDDGTWLFGPDANVLLSNTFLSLHCFRLERRADRRGQIGLAFEPVAGRRVPDIAGTMWLDESTARLRHVEYSYRNVANYEDNRYAGGRTEFEQLPNGAWIVRRWFVRSPLLARQPGVTQLKTIGVRETGGEVLDVQIAGVGTTTIVPRYKIAGMAFDSVSGRPLAGARVYLSGTPFAATTTLIGRFQMDSVPAGDYLLAFSHPSLDSLPRYPEPTRIAAYSDLTNVVVATPSAEQVTNSVCPAESWTRAAALSQDTTSANRGVLFGTVSGSLGPIDQSTVDARWARVKWAGPGEHLTAATAKNLSMRGYGFGVATDEAGFYSLCRLPVDRPIVLEIKDRDVLLMRDTVRISESGIQRRDYKVKH